METIFLQEVKALNDYLNLEYEIYYWRTTEGQEVDFVLYGPRGILAFEIKRSRILSSKDSKGLFAFEKDYPEAKLFLLYGGNRREYYGNVQVIPYLDLLLNLRTLLEQTTFSQVKDP